jgi:hypothetical protein
MMTVGRTRPLARVVLRSVWRLFWNQIVTDFTSLNEKKKKRQTRRDGGKRETNMLADRATDSRCSRDG